MTGRHGTVDASPTKKFFVDMLTRDVKPEDAILDLLDNCVDGINRSGKKSGPKPYDGFKAEIRFDAESFSITDNCGGIPWDLRDYAFRMGRPSEAEPVSGSVGTCGMGMKRAIFKMGRRCIITTKNGSRQYAIKITPEWLEDEDAWEIGVGSPKSGPDGASTAITIDRLHDGIAKTFREDGEAFGSSLIHAISTYYAYIMDKGFTVTVNGKEVKPKMISILYNRENGGVKPFVYESEVDGVGVYLAVGLNGNIPSGAAVNRELESPARAAVNAGWTVLCNDRAVLHCDRTAMTGWGDAGVPLYHSQFNAISGVVEFRSDDPSKLPTTTTKRGLDGSSPLYLQVKNKMREGIDLMRNANASLRS